MSSRRSVLSYGPDRRQVGELWLPESARGSVPVVVLFHGGFWRAPYTKQLLHRLASDVVRRGWAAWNVEYRRVGRLGGGGGWPTTLADAASALDHVVQLEGVDLGRVAVCGHSAGAQLALWCAGSGPLRSGFSSAGADQLTVRAAVSLAGVLDLADGSRLGLGGGAVDAFLGGSPDSVPDRYRVASPIEALPAGIALVVVHGAEDSVVPPAMSERFAKVALSAGDSVIHESVPDHGHLALMDPHREAWRTAAAHLERLFA